MWPLVRKVGTADIDLIITTIKLRNKYKNRVVVSYLTHTLCNNLCNHILCIKMSPVVRAIIEQSRIRTGISILKKGLNEQLACIVQTVSYKSMILSDDLNKITSYSLSCSPFTLLRGVRVGSKI